MRRAICGLVEAHFHSVPAFVKEGAENISDMTHLGLLLKAVAKASSLEEVRRAVEKALTAHVA